MNATLFKTLIAMVPTSMLLAGAVLAFSRVRSLSSLLQLIGTGSLLIVVLTHLCEAFNLFPLMHWGSEHSAGHYLDLFSAVLGAALFPLGYLWASIALRSNGRV